MQGVRIFACALLATLAVPAALLANEEPASSPPAEPTHPHTEDQHELPVPPTDEGEAVVPSEKPTGTDTSGSPSPAEPAAPEPAAPEPAAPEPSGGSDEPKGDAKRSVRSKRRRGEDRNARAAAVRTVIMRDIKFHPRNVTIDVGDTLRWENRDEEPHNATARDGSFETKTFTKGGSASHTFNRAGKFPYVCTIHQGMNATVTVTGSGSGSPDAGGGTGSGDGGTGSGGTSSGSDSDISSPGGSSGTGSLSRGGRTSNLPSTGQDLVWLVLAGAGLLTLGAAMRLLVGRRA